MFRSTSWVHEPSATDSGGRCPLTRLGLWGPQIHEKGPQAQGYRFGDPCTDPGSTGPWLHELHPRAQGYQLKGC